MRTPLRRVVLLASVGLGCASSALAAPDPLPSWRDGAAKEAIVAFVEATTRRGSPAFVPLAERVATFDQDGTLWVEQPMYAQIEFCLDRVPAVVAAHPELATTEPYATILSGEAAAIGKLTSADLEPVLEATLSGMSVDAFAEQVAVWLRTARDPRWNRPYTDLTYLPMQEVLRYFRANGYATYIVTGGGQDFVRVYADATYGIPVERVVGSIGGTTYGYTPDGEPVLTKDPTLLLNDDDAGKPEAIHLVIGRHPRAAFGNSTGDQQMLEYATAGEGARLGLLVLHDDADREYAYGPARGLPATTVGTFTDALSDEAGREGWIVVSMKTDWNRIFSFDGATTPADVRLGAAR